MKRNEYVTRQSWNTQPVYWKSGNEELWILEGMLYCADDSDLRWFNFNGFTIGDIRLGGTEMNSDSFIIGD